jgi:precorrin-2 dehydrogenase/sirohydrochlorin ferrochelatase
MLDLSDRLCLVVGGGMVGTRKTRGLLAAGARVRLVAPHCSAELRHLAELGRLEWRPKAYSTDDLEGATLVFAATADRALNASVAGEARRRAVLANLADDPVESDFQLPAVVERAGLTMAISTGGSSPAFARRLREQLDAWLTPERLELFALYAELRADLRAERRSVDSSAWAAVDDRALQLLQEGRRSEAARLLRRQVLAGGSGGAE